MLDFSSITWKVHKRTVSKNLKYKGHIIVRRYANQKTKFGRFLARNGGNLWGGFKREVFIKFYKYPNIRRLVRKFYRPRDPEKWLFLVGCYNSGTTILRDIIASHPNISELPFEGVKLTDAFPDLEAGGWPRMMYRNYKYWDKIPHDAADRARADWAPWWDKSATIFLEKSIDHSTRIDWLNKNFKNAYFLSITRNGLAVAEGIARRSKPVGNAVKELGQDHYPLEMIANQWCAFDEKISQDLAGVQNKLSITYEDLMANTQNIISQVFAFLDLSAPTVIVEGNTVTVNGRAFELIDQNLMAIARLDPERREKLHSHMHSTLEKYGYKGLV